MAAGVGVLAFTPVLAVMMGVVASLFLMVLVIALVVKSRLPRDNRRQEIKMVCDNGASGSTATPLQGATAVDEEDSFTNAIPKATDDANPDVIPVNDGEQKGNRRECCRIGKREGRSGRQKEQGRC